MHGASRLKKRDMKTMKLWMCAAILICGLGYMTSCNGNAEADKTAAQQDAQATGETDFLAAVDRYLIDSIGAHYSQGDLCIPSAMVLASQENSDSVMVWGDFWVFNYKFAGDTLKTVSGGDHPGLMTLKKNEEGKYVVTAFEQVEDGHGNEASAKRIFADKYERFHAINSNEQNRELFRASCIAKFLKANDLSYKYYQDYGWPAQEIPVK